MITEWIKKHGGTRQETVKALTANAEHGESLAKRELFQAQQTLAKAQRDIERESRNAKNQRLLIDGLKRIAEENEAGGG